MIIKAEEFPLYDLLVKLKAPGIDNLVADMAKAQNGDLNDAYQVALGLYQVASIPNIDSQIPGFTPQAKSATLTRCAEVFEVAAAGGHAAAKAMADYVKSVGGPSGPTPG